MPLYNHTCGRSKHGEDTEYIIEIHLKMIKWKIFIVFHLIFITYKLTNNNININGISPIGIANGSPGSSSLPTFLIL